MTVELDLLRSEISHLESLVATLQTDNHQLRGKLGRYTNADYKKQYYTRNREEILRKKKANSQATKTLKEHTS